MRHPTDSVVQHPRLLLLGQTVAEQRRINQFAMDLARWLYGEPRDQLAPLARVVTLVARRELADARLLCRGRALLSVESAARAVEALWPLLRGPDELPPPSPQPPPSAQSSGGEGGGGSAGDSNSQGDDSDGNDEATDNDEAEASGAEQDGGGEDGDTDGNGSDDGDAESDDEQDGENEQKGNERDSEATAPDDTADLSPEEILSALADSEELDPELSSLAERLTEALGPETDTLETGEQLADWLSDAASASTEAAVQAEELTRQLEHFAPGIGWSTAPGRLERSLLGRLDDLARLLSKMRELRQLADMLGRTEDATRRQGREMGGQEEVVGVTVGGEVRTALPSELALLADPETEDLFYQRVIERRLVSLELTGAGLEGRSMGNRKGPVIACIDTSGSMSGPPELAAKAMVLALCRRVLPQGRAVHLLIFGGREEQVEIVLKRGIGGLEGLLDFLNLQFNAGTDFDTPLLRAMSLLEEQEWRDADVLVVTDGLCRATRPVIDRVAEVREKVGMRVWSVLFGQRNPGTLEPFSDEVFVFDPTEATAAAGLFKRMRR